MAENLHDIVRENLMISFVKKFEGAPAPPELVDGWPLARIREGNEAVISLLALQGAGVRLITVERTDLVPGKDRRTGEESLQPRPSTPEDFIWALGFGAAPDETVRYWDNSGERNGSRSFLVNLASERPAEEPELAQMQQYFDQLSPEK
jgi:hypothetical protein